jgi:hypothetical protein
MSLKVLIVSPHGMKCGIASDAEVLRSLRDYLKRNLAVVEEVFESEGVAYGAYRQRA